MPIASYGSNKKTLRGKDVVQLPDDMSFRDACVKMLTMPIIATIDARYDEPWRAYHNKLHITEMMDHVLDAENDGVKIHDGCAALVSNTKANANLSAGS